MKTAILVPCIFILWGVHNFNTVDSKKVPVSTIIEATKKIIKVAPKLKLPKNLPKLPPIILEKAKQVLRLRDRVDPAAWKKVEETVNFFQSVTKALKNQNVTSYDKLPQGWNLDEILWCHPSDGQSRCFSTCQQQGEKYTWCFTSKAQSDWQHCACSIRPLIRHWISLAKKRLLEKSQQAKISMMHEGKNEMIQWIVIATLAFLVMILVTGIVARVVYNYRRAQDVVPPNIVIVENVEPEQL